MSRRQQVALVVVVAVLALAGAFLLGRVTGNDTNVNIRNCPPSDGAQSYLDRAMGC